MVRHVINQDRDQIFLMKGDLVTMPVLSDERVLLGFALHCGDGLIGSFDSQEETIKVMEEIVNSEEEVYVTPGYEPWEDD